MIIGYARTFGGGGGSMAGYDAGQAVISGTTTTTGFSGTITGVTSGDLVVLFINVMGNSAGTLNGSAYTVTVDGNAATHVRSEPSGGVSNTRPVSSIWSWTATSSGDLTVSVTTNVSVRACHVIGYTLQNCAILSSGGGNTGTSLVNSVSSPNSATPAATGNVFISSVASTKGTLTGYSASPATVDVTGATGGTTSSDVTAASAYYVCPDTSAVTFSWSWTTTAITVYQHIEIEPA